MLAPQPGGPASSGGGDEDGGGGEGAGLLPSTPEKRGARGAQLPLRGYGAAVSARVPRLELPHCPHPGECNTDVHINNCEQPRPPPAAAGSNGPRTHMNRDNDVYKRVPCPSPSPPPAPPPPPPQPFLPNGGLSGGLSANDSTGSSDNPAGIIILVLFLVLAVAAAALVVYKGWAKPIARSVAMWVRGDTDASAYIRNRDSARGGSTAPVQGLGGSVDEPNMTRLPAGASTYNPPA